MHNCTVAVCQLYAFFIGISMYLDKCTVGKISKIARYTILYRVTLIEYITVSIYISISEFTMKQYKLIIRLNQINV